jgi:two-component system, OmpR family, alkaline phosphatase synthesis response regulator PhoP
MENQKKKVILLIEDDRALQSAVAEILEQGGFETVSAFDGEEGLKKLSEIEPDLILLDIILPRLNGYEVLAEIKKDEAKKDIPVLILTNLEQADNVQKALDLGATTFMVKSDYSLKDVLEKVRENIK